MKPSIITTSAAFLIAGSLQAAQITFGNSIITTANSIGAGDNLQQNDGTATIATGGSITVTSASSVNSWVGQMGSGGFIIDGGSLTVNTTAGFIIGNGNQNTGTIDLREGSLTLTPGGLFAIGRDLGTGIVTIRGGSADFGSLPDFDDHAPAKPGTGTIDFADKVGGGQSDGTLTITGADSAYYENLYNTTGDLTYNGGNTAAFADVFVVNGETLSVVPEPSSMALVLGGAGILLLRRRRA